MRVLLRLVLALILIVAALAVIVARDSLSRATTPLAPGIALAIIGLLVGVLIAASRRVSKTTNQDAVLALSSSHGETPRAHPDSIEERALIAFAKSLLGATTSEDLRATVESQLPVLLQGRKVWIAFDQHARNASATQTHARVQHGGVLTQDVQEWTTFALRLGEQGIGLLGIESSGGLSPHLKERIQSIAPLIAQALKSAQEVDIYREASVVDLLTGAATRREGLNRLQAEVKRAQRTGSTMAVMMLDLDHFKSINDRYGHAIGDLLLTAIGQTMGRTLRASDIRCRWGGEEFLVVLPDTSLAQAQVVATHLLHNIAATTVASAKGPVVSTASIGLTVSRTSETDTNRIVSRADMALYQAKNSGRACIRVVLGGFDGEPVVNGDRRTAANAGGETVPFPDRRSNTRSDRRRVPSPGRRRTDPQVATGAAALQNAPFVEPQRASGE
jgi:diguanylate cyclase (GGDEF)-like protein